MMTDLRSAWREATVRPGLSAMVVAVLALGIGAATAIFSLVDAVLFRPLPITEPERVVRVFRVGEDGRPNNNLAFPSFADLRDRARSFSHVAAYQDWAPFNLAVEGGEPMRVAGAVVTGQFFDLFGTPPLLGRYLTPDDDGAPGAHPVVVIGERLWHSRFAADPAVIGRGVIINTHPFTVVGVMPRRFGGASAQPDVDAWVPMSMLEQAAPMERWSYLDQRGMSWLDAVARLAPGVSIEAARAEVAAIGAALMDGEGLHPSQVRIGLIEASRAAVDPYGFEGSHRNALLLLAVVGALLLIAVANAAGLLLVRTEERVREIALRLGLGASRGRVLRMLLVEAVVHALVAAVLGILLGSLALAAVLEPLAGMLGSAGADPELLIDARVLAFGVALAVLAASIATVSPALRVFRLDLNSALKQGGARSGDGRARTRRVVVAAQVCLAAGLLAMALLLVRSFWHTAVINPGFDTSRTLVASLDLLRQGYDGERATAAQEAVLERLAAHPAVESAAFVSVVPVQSAAMRSTLLKRIRLPDAEVPDGTATRLPDAEVPNATTTDINFVSPGYFATMRIPQLRGRGFDTGDATGASRVAMVNRAFAERWFADGESIGESIEILAGNNAWEIVGIVADSKLRSLREDPQPAVYFPLAQRADPEASIVVRGRGADPWALLPALREAVAGVDPALPLIRPRTLVDHVGRSFAEAQVMAWLVGATAALAVLLSAAGLYGLMAWQVRVRSREIGIRVALGADAASVRRSVIVGGLRLVAFGLPFGLLAAILAGRGLEGMLFGVSAHDPATLLAVAVGFLLLTFAATWIPANRSARVDPMTSLRDE